MSEGQSFGEWLARRMTEMGLPRPSDLAKATGIDASLIGRWIRGESLPGMKNLGKIAPILDVTEAEIAARAGHLAATPGTPPPPRPPRRAIVQELERLLGPESPLPTEQQSSLESLVVALVAPYRSYGRRRRKAG